MSDHGPEQEGLASADPDAPAREPEPAGRSSARHRRAVEWLVVIVLAVGIALLLRLFVVQSFYIPSVSMEPTLNVGDRILVDKLAYHLHGVGRGDIIVFHAPPGVAVSCATSDTVLVKRVIGLPGERVSGRGGHVYIDGTLLPEPWLPKNDADAFTAPFAPVYVTANHYFVMGDNRTNSCDSRMWGTVARSEIIGKADMRIWPITRIGFF